MGPRHIQGGPPVRDFTNQNARMLDDARIKSGIPLGQDFGMHVQPSLQPVLVVEPDAAPLPSSFGFVPITVAAGGAGLRSEIVVAGQAQDRNSVIEVFITVFPAAAGSSFEFIFGAILVASTRTTIPISDNRRGQVGATGWLADSPSVFVGSKNTAAATAGGIRAGTGINTLQPYRVGPIYFDNALFVAGTPSSHVIVRPQADNLGINALVEWRQLQRQPS